MNTLRQNNQTIVQLLVVGIVLISGAARASDKINGKNDDALPPRLAAKACRATADELARNGHRREAIVLYERARASDPKHVEVSHVLAVLYDLEHQDKRAVDEFQQALRKTPHDANVLNDFGYFYLQRKDYEKAEDYLRRALKSDPHHERALTNLGLALGAQGRFETAFRVFESAVGPAAAHSNIGMLLAKNGNTSEAARAFRNALQSNPDLKQAQIGLEVVTKRLNADSNVEMASYESDVK